MFGIIYALIMIATVLIVDVLYFRDQALHRLVANVLIVLAFGSVYVIFLRRPNS